MKRGTRSKRTQSPRKTSMQKYHEARNSNILWIDDAEAALVESEQEERAFRWPSPGKRRKNAVKDPLSSYQYEEPNIVSVQVIQNLPEEEDDDEFEEENSNEEEEDDDASAEPPTADKTKEKPEEPVPSNMLKCHSCNGFFVDVEELQYHNRIVHGFPFGCKIPKCVQAFKTLPDLKKHLDSDHKQNSEEVFECTKCVFWALNKASLLKHMSQKHEILFKCKTCNKTFKSQTLLASHRKTAHERGQQCFYCDRFMNLNVFAKHSTPTNCQYCAMKFNCSVWLAKHQIRDCHRTLPSTSATSSNETEHNETVSSANSNQDQRPNNEINASSTPMKSMISLNGSLVLDKARSSDTVIVLVNPANSSEQRISSFTDVHNMDVKGFLQNFDVTQPQVNDDDDDHGDYHEDSAPCGAEEENLTEIAIQAQEQQQELPESFEVTEELINQVLSIEEPATTKKGKKKKEQVVRTEEEKRAAREGAFTRENRKLREAGEAYLGRVKLKDGSTLIVNREARNTLKPACKPGNKCWKSNLFGCKFFSEAEREIIIKGFWSKPWAEKRAFILSNTEASHPLRKNFSADKARNLTFKYFLRTQDGTRRRVCQTMFNSTIRVPNSTISGWLKEDMEKFGTLPLPPEKPMVDPAVRRGERIAKKKTLENFLQVLLKDAKQETVPVVHEQYNGSTVVKICQKKESVSKLYKYYCSIVDDPVPPKAFNKAVKDKNIPMHLIKVAKVMSARSSTAPGQKGNASK